MRKTLKIIAALLVILLPVALLPAAAFSLPDMYGETFVGELDEKYERLTSIEEEKIILVGGSSVAFGIDSERIESYFGMPVVNFGLYADLGTKVMMDLSRAGIRQGDIVILLPEISEQTLSLYFNADTTLKATDGNRRMLLNLRGDDILSTVGALWRFASEKISLSQKGDVSHGTGIYDARYFNEYGDLDPTVDLDGDGIEDYPRLANVMRTYYDASTPITLSPDVFDEDFIKYVQEYKAFCEARGATFYFGFCPMNASAVTDASEETLDAFTKFLKTSFGKNCLLGDASDHIFEAGYFYDTNFHLNQVGVLAQTLTLVNELVLAEERMDVQVKESIPPAPALPEYDMEYPGEDDDNCRYFTFEFITSYDATLGKEVEQGYRITGLSAEGKTQTSLTLPVNYQGYRVTALGADALAQGACRTLILPAAFDAFSENSGTQVFDFGDSCFRDSGIRDLWICIADPSNIRPPVSLDGLASDFVIHVSSTSFLSEYNWSMIGISSDHYAFDSLD